MAQLTHREAVDVLFEGREVDLTADGYREAISALRVRSPAQANQVERALRPTLEELFPRREIEWHNTSRGTVYRLALLADNPLFDADVRWLREVLEIPEEGLAGSAADALRASIDAIQDEWGLSTEVFLDRELASRWIRQHHRFAAGFSADGLSEGLSTNALRFSAE